VRVLTVNAGSSSLKVRLLDHGDEVGVEEEGLEAMAEPMKSDHEGLSGRGGHAGHRPGGA